MKPRDPKDILHKGVRLSDALEAHGRWLAGEGDGERMDWSDASMADANMDGTIGNMREIKSAQFDQWPLTWTTTPEGEVTLQIGYQRHNLSLWEKSDPRWINAMDLKAAEWWAKYRDVVLALVKASPAAPYGKENI